MNRKKLINTLFIGLLLCSCSNNKNSSSLNNNSQPNQIETPVVIRNYNYSPLDKSFEIKLEEEVLFSFSNSSETRLETTLKANIGYDELLSKINVTIPFFYYKEMSTTVIVLTSEEIGTDISNFYKVGGKVVKHTGGEDPAIGANLYVDGNLFKTIQDDENGKNFDIPFVHKNSTISVGNEGKEYIDLSLLPFDSFKISEEIFNSLNTIKTYVNGQEIEIKEYAPLTFREKDF